MTNSLRITLFSAFFVACFAEVQLSAQPDGGFRLIGPGNVWTEDASPVFLWMALDLAKGDGVPLDSATRYEVLVDGVKIAGDLNGTSLVSPVKLAAGPHSWSVKAVDAAGHVIRESDAPLSFTIGTPPRNLWDDTDRFESGNLSRYRTEGFVITSDTQSGTRSAAFNTASGETMHYAFNPAFTNEKEAETTILFSMDGGHATVGVGFANGEGVQCYALVDQATGNLRIERRARYSIFDHTEAGFAKKNWKERKDAGFFVWTADEVKIPEFTPGRVYRLRFDLSNRLPSMGKAAMAVIEDRDGKVLQSLKTFLDDVNTPHPLFLGSGDKVRIDEFHYRALDRWAYNWRIYPQPVNPHFTAYNPVVWRDQQTRKWYLWSRIDSRIRWSDDGIHWSTDAVPGPPVQAWDPAIIGMYGDPWKEGRTYLASPGGNFDSVKIYSTANVMSGNWTKYSEHPGLRGKDPNTRGSGREHVILDAKDWPKLSLFNYNGTAYRFLHITEGDVGAGGSTMMRLSNNLKDFTVVEGKDLFSNETNLPVLSANLWAMECLNVCTSCAAAIDGDIRVMTFKNGPGSSGEVYHRAIPQEAILDGREPWKLKAIQTIPGFPYYWGESHNQRSKYGASWYGGFCQWPACYVWVPEERTLYCYWGEEDVIGLSTARIIPEISCTWLSVASATILVGGNLPVRANFSNTGSAEGEEDVAFYLDRDNIHTQKVRLAANADTEITFNIPAPKPGVHLLRISNRTFCFMVAEPAHH
jgi:hypothetical protein